MSTSTDGAAVPPGDDERRSRLFGVKLHSLVAEHLGHPVDVATEGFPGGAALCVDEAAWVLVDGNAARSLGPALAWSVRRGATSLNLVVEHDSGLLARRASRLSLPTTVWFAQERLLLAVVPEPLAAPATAPAAHLALTSVIEGAGATALVEHGVVVGEVRGLEVCRVVDQPTVGHFAELGDFDVPAPVGPPAEAGVLLEVGVGANDREAFRMLHGDIPTVEALGSVVDSVLAHRASDSPQHPLNRLGQERYLRWQLECDPALVDMVEVAAAEPPQSRPNLKDPIPCVARGVDADGVESSIVCSAGIDVDLVGFVADVQEMYGLRVVVVLRERDAVAITRDVLACLAAPVEIRPIVER